MAEIAKRPLADKILISIIIFLAPCISFALVTTFHCHEDNPEVLKQISSFYGPGAFYAWMITSLSTLIFIDFGCLQASSSDDDHAGNPSVDKIPTTCTGSNDERHALLSSFDAGLLVIVAYPLVASVDVLQSVARDKDAPQRRAALVVVQVAQPICCLGIAAAHCRLEMRTRRARACVWSIGAFASALATVPGTLRESSPVVGVLSIFFIIVSGGITPLIAADMAIPTMFNALQTIPGHPMVPWRWFDLALCTGSSFLVLVSAWPGSRNKNSDACAHRLDWSIPRSDASIYDLVQVTALGVAIIYSSIMLSILAVKEHRRLEGSWRIGESAVSSCL